MKSIKNYILFVSLSIFSNVTIGQEVNAIEKSIMVKKDSLALVEQMILAEKANTEAIKTAKKEQKAVEKRTEKAEDASDRFEKSAKKEQKAVEK